MGFRPSDRRKAKEKIDTELPLTPVMNLFLCMVPMLLLAAVFQNVAILNLFLPTAEEAASTMAPEGEDFTLAVVLTRTELSLRKDDQVLWRASTLGEGKMMDLPALNNALAGVKAGAPGKKDLILMVDKDVEYDSIIQVMDAVRVKGREELFPDISLADRVLGGA